MNQDPRNSTITMHQTFGKQEILNDITRNPEHERIALERMNLMAPDLVGMVLGGVL